MVKGKAVALAVGLGLVLLSLPPARADEPAADKWQYNLFNPTPRELMRKLSTDRPDVTESPYSVDAGHVQVEMSFVEYTRDGGGAFEEFAFVPVNLKVGLLNNVDLQLVLSPYTEQDLRLADNDEGDDDPSGFGETQLRLKINLWGNDGGPTALALMPFIEVPTASDDLGEPNGLEGGLIIPFVTELPAGFSLGLMAEFDVVRASEDDGDYELEFVHTASISHDIVGELAGYVEYIGLAPSEDDADYAAAVGMGLTYGLGPDVQLDGGVNIGLNGEAEDLVVFTGLSFRL